MLIALNVFRKHPNEAFSSLRIEGYKSFLRMHIAPDGRLDVYPIGLRRVPKDGGNGPLDPHLIEGPIRVG